MLAQLVPEIVVGVGAQCDGSSVYGIACHSVGDEKLVMQSVVAPIGRQIGNGDFLVGEIPFAVGTEGGVGSQHNVCALF